MLAEFIDFVKSTLPSVSPDMADNAKMAISQFEKDGHQPNYLLSTPLQQLSQGDIITNITFSYFSDDGDQKVFKADALVISTSCHIDQKLKLVLVPVMPISAYPGTNTDELYKNKIYDYMYIPDSIMSEKFINFGIINTYNKNLIMKGIQSNSIKRIASLNQIGYYLFIIKLTVYLMRKEDDETFSERNN